jgi:hypothetical protein
MSPDPKFLRTRTHPTLAPSRPAQGPCSGAALRMANLSPSAHKAFLTKSPLPARSWTLSHPACAQERTTALPILQRCARPDGKDRAPTRPAIVPGDPQGRGMKPIPTTRHLAAACLMRSKPFCVRISRVMTRYDCGRVCPPNSLSHCHPFEKLGGSAASASDHRGACRASNRPFHPLLSANPLE